jgi:hypothetical protein
MDGIKMDAAFSLPVKREAYLAGQLIHCTIDWRIEDVCIESMFHRKAPHIVNDPMNKSSIPWTLVVGAGGTGQGSAFLARLVKIDCIGHIQVNKEVYS